MKRLITFLFRYSPSLAFFALLAGVITGATNTALIALINEAIEAGGKAELVVIWSFVGLCILLPVTRIVAQVSLTKLSQTAIYDLRMFLSKRIISAPLRRLEQHGHSELLAALTSDIIAISNALAEIPFLCMHFTIVLSCLAYLAWLNWIAGIGMVIATILGVLLFNLVSSRAQYFLGVARGELDNLYQHFRGLTEGNKELKMHRPRRESFLSELLGLTGSSYRASMIKGNAYFAAAGSMGQLMFFAVIGMAVFLLPVLDPSITKDVLTGYSLVLLYMVVPLDALTSIIPSLSTAVIALDKVEGLGVSLDKFSVEDQHSPDPKQSFGNIEMRNITHTYHREKEDQTFQMGPINLSFKPGELVFIVGGNGSGKTTLAKMITGLYAPESGQVFLDDQEITDENRDTYRQYFTTVYSDFYLFTSLLGIDTTKIDDHISDYLKRLHLDHKVKVENRTFSTIDLSQGQRKRLSLLTAYLEDRPIYLFDEWAADQDPIFKEIFYLQLLTELKEKGKTVLVVTHDDHYFHVADRIIKLDYGQIEYDKSLAAG